MLVRIEKGISEQNLKEIYSDPYLIVEHDQRQFAPIEHPLVKYVSAFVGQSFAGAFMLVENTSVETEIHAFIKRDFVMYSRILGKKIIDFAFVTRPIFRLSAQVIDGFTSAKNYCIKCGMTVEGFKRNVCTINGVPKGVHILGITREDWI